MKQAATVRRSGLRGLGLMCLALAALVLALPTPAGDAHVAQLSIDGPIGPATTDYLTRSMSRAQEAGARAIVIRMDTPGGLDAATRDIIKAILASPLPVITYVHPAGSRAASAGTYILYASHVAAMTPATTLGAATPVAISPMGAEPERPRSRERDDDGGEGGEAEPPLPGSAMERKVINDAVAFIRGLAERNNRNAEWAERAVREAVSLTASEALAQNVVDLLAVDVPDLLAQLEGRELNLESGPVTLALAELPVRHYDPDWRNELLALITNPQVASILLLIGIYGLILEGYNPGALVPGVVGVICLLLALYALQVLPVNYAGLALILVGAALILAEALSPSFGVLGIGGVIALVVGSLILVDRDVPGMEVSYPLLGVTAAVSALTVLGLMVFVGRSLRQPRLAANQAMVGRLARVRLTNPAQAQLAEIEHPNPARVALDGELWNAWSHQPLAPEQEVRVIAQQGLLLQVEPLPAPESS